MEIMIWLQCMRTTTKECRFYFPHFKEKLKFRRIVKVEAEENQLRTFYRLS